MTKLFTLALLTTGLAGNAYGSAQDTDRLIYNGATNRLCTLPLENHLKKHNLFISQMAPADRMVLSTANLRGYVGTWQIKEGFLWLVSVQTVDGSNVPLSKLFLGQDTPVKATWYSGTLRITQGKMLRYVHVDFNSVFEREVLIEIKEGKVTGEKVVENNLDPAAKSKNGK